MVSNTRNAAVPLKNPPAIHPRIPVDLRRLHAAIIDHEHKLVAFVTKDTITNSLVRDLPKVAEGFDALRAGDLARLNDVSARIMTIFAQAHAGTPMSEEPCKTIWRLLKNALDTALSELHVVRNGFRVQAGALARMVVEILGVVCHLLFNPDDVEKLLAVNLNRPRRSRPRS